MKIFTLAPKENWICDRFVSEWKTNNTSITTENPEQADIIWLLADWCWDQMDLKLLMRKKVVASVHHIVPEKFSEKELTLFNFRFFNWQFSKRY